MQTRALQNPPRLTADEVSRIPAFLIRCRECNKTLERDKLRDAQLAVQLHWESMGHRALVYGLCLGNL